LSRRNLASRIEADSPYQNIIEPTRPPPAYRSWNLWGYPDSIPGVYAYDAESDADNAICEFLGKQGPVDEATRVSQRLREKWWSWSVIEAEQAQSREKSKL
jgi:hypothetical protein